MPERILQPITSVLLVADNNNNNTHISIPTMITTLVVHQPLVLQWKTNRKSQVAYRLAP